MQKLVPVAPKLTPPREVVRAGIMETKRLAALQEDINFANKYDQEDVGFDMFDMKVCVFFR